MTKNECQDIASSFKGSIEKNFTAITCRLHDDYPRSNSRKIPCECMFGIRFRLAPGEIRHIILFINFLAENSGFAVKSYKDDEQLRTYSCLLEK